MVFEEEDKMQIKYSVIIPVYNAEKTLKRCLDSLLGQKRQDVEIILINDGSSDRSGEIIDEYRRKYGSIVSLEQENSGVSAARNRGLNAATGTYILFVDSDDRIREDLVSITVQTAEDSGADVVIFDYAGEDTDRRQTDLFTFDLPAGRAFSPEEEPSVIMKTCSAVNKLFRREFWEKTASAFPAGRYYEDLAGIKNAKGSIGFRHIEMNPCFPEGLNHVKASYMSTNGMIRSEWYREEKNFTWRITIPGNCQATVHIPLRFCPEQPEQPGIQQIEKSKDSWIVTVGSGDYVF